MTKIKTNRSDVTVKKSKDKPETIIEEQNTLVVYNQEEEQTFNLSFEISQLDRTSLQLLESLDIINETKSIDTLSGRINFVNAIFNKFIKLRSLPQYERQAQRGIDRYKELYYNKTLKDFQFSLLMNPDVINLEKFYGTAILEAYKKFVNSHEMQIQTLQRASAILKRKEDIFNVGYTAQRIFKDYEIPDYLNNIEQIEDIRKKYYEYQKA